MDLRSWLIVGWLAGSGLAGGAAEVSPGDSGNDAAPSAPAPHPVLAQGSFTNSYQLKVAEHWLLNLPDQQRFDASALLFLPDGTLYTVNDKSAGLYRIDRHTTGTADLTRDPRWFTPLQLTNLSVGKLAHWDLEGLALDPQGRIYFCEEQNRWVIRADPARGTMERLEIDWAPVRKWFSADRNASWEGIAVGNDGRLYLANERSIGRIIVVDLASLRVIDDFAVAPLGRVSRDFMYSDLAWFGDDLWVLCRQSRRVVRVNPQTHRVLADFDYTNIEISSEFGYITPLPYGQFEGLAVDAGNIWLVIDNNGSPRVRHKPDTRPTLFRCRRPDLAPE